MIKLILVVVLFKFSFINCNLSLELDPPNNVFDDDLYKRVLDPELCQKQINYILKNDTFLLAEFLDAGFRTPRGVLMGNTLDMGSYYQCLAINRETAQTQSIEGKYCVLKIPLNQNISFTYRHDNNFDPSVYKLETKNKGNIQRYDERSFREFHWTEFNGVRLSTANPFNNTVFRVAICLPKSCTTKEAINDLLINISDTGFQYEDDFCRLPKDKVWVTGDTVAVVILSIVGLLTFLSTGYDVWHTKCLKKDCKDKNIFLCLFSIYTNAQNVLTFKPSSNSLDCIDGIRALSMSWIILSHSFSSQSFVINSIDVFQWTSSYAGIWIMAGHIAVDTFFMLSGLLVVYNAAGKLTSLQLIKNLHLFYLNRLLRMFPILAFTILLDATTFNHVSDGPFWGNVVDNANRCKTFWWTTLLHVQNYVNPESICVRVTWYLAIDVQLHILSPLVLFWILGRRKAIALTALTCTFLATLAAATTYNFINEFPSSVMMTNRAQEQADYMRYYYMNTLTRASPFIVGMLFGYMLHVWKGQKLKLSKVLNAFFWIFALSTLSLVVYSAYPIRQLHYDNQTADSVINSLMRPSWALGLAWITFACVKGYGGPINWFLSLRIWKLPARLSYGLYLLHYSLMVLVNSSRINPIYFTVGSIIFKFMGFYFLSMVVSFAVTVIVDQPFSIIFKMLLETGKQKDKEPKIVESTKINNVSNPETNITKSE